MQLYEQLETVVDETTFLAFVAALEKDLRANAGGRVDNFGRNEHGWENHSIEDFLKAAHAWAEDSKFGSKQGLASESPWKKFAVFLFCGKIYE